MKWLHRGVTENVFCMIRFKNACRAQGKGFRCNTEDKGNVHKCLYDV